MQREVRQMVSGRIQPPDKVVKDVRQSLQRPVMRRGGDFVMVEQVGRERGPDISEIADL